MTRMFMALFDAPLGGDEVDVDIHGVEAAELHGLKSEHFLEGRAGSHGHGALRRLFRRR